MIRIGRESQCLPYAGFFLQVLKILTNMEKSGKVTLKVTISTFLNVEHL